jgi:hypothetical protein
MIQFITKKFSFLKNLIPLRNRPSVFGYLSSLMLPAQRHSLANASEKSGLHKSQFSRMLANPFNPSEEILKELNIRAVDRALSIDEKDIPPGYKKTEWSAYLIVDSTAQRRSDSGAENIGHYNHGGGFWYGHRVTNLVLLINDKTIPLKPFHHFTRKYCKQNNIPYKTENDSLVEYLKNFKVTDYTALLQNSDVVVLLDAGYDVKQIQRLLVDTKLDFITAIHSSRSVIIEQAVAGAKQVVRSVSNMFRFFYKKAKKVNCWVSTTGSKWKRVKYTVQRIDGFLKGIKGHKMAILKSTQGNGKAKYLACSRTDVSTTQIVLAYSKRFTVEVFHKEGKVPGF